MGSKKWSTNLRIKRIINLDDIITIHVPAKADGTALITKAELNMLKDDAFVVNVSRGGVIDEEALYKVLQSGKLSAVALDVFSQEPQRTFM